MDFLVVLTFFLWNESYYLFALGIMLYLAIRFIPMTMTLEEVEFGLLLANFLVEWGSSWLLGGLIVLGFRDIVASLPEYLCMPILNFLIMYVKMVWGL